MQLVCKHCFVSIWKDCDLVALLEDDSGMEVTFDIYNFLFALQTRLIRNILHFMATRY